MTPAAALTLVYMRNLQAFTSQLRIRTKSGAIEQFELNKAQLYLHDLIEKQRQETGKVRVVILKGRQQGISTYTAARFFWRTIYNEGIKTFIMTHQQQATDNLFEMVKRYHQLMPEFYRPPTAFDNAKELTFTATDSGYKVATAGNRGSGRSSTIQQLHLSEVAFYPSDEAAIGMLEAVPDEIGSEVIVESTANGTDNLYYRMWKQASRGESDYLAVFLPWFWQDEYTINDDSVKLEEEDYEIGKAFGIDIPHLKWRKKKIANMGGDVLKFKREYPNTPEEAFETSTDDVLIQAAKVRLAMRNEETRPNGYICLGVDPARFGGDMTAIVVRQGRKVHKIYKYAQQDTMQVAGLVRRVMSDWKPKYVFVDTVGIGAGVYDRLIELGHRNVLPVVAGAKAEEFDRYVNKRAEMWARMRDWLDDEMGVSLPDSDELAQELTGLRYSYDSNGRIKLERKDDLKARGEHSPDMADALALTFAQLFEAAPVDDERGSFFGGGGAWAGDTTAGY